MTKATAEQLMLAILAMDAYSRADKEPKRLLMYEGDKELSKQIGGVTWDFSSDQQNRIPASAATGFSASKYSMGGNTVIAYRMPLSFSDSYRTPARCFGNRKQSALFWAH
jgi:hypothetical protein